MAVFFPFSFFTLIKRTTETDSKRDYNSVNSVTRYYCCTLSSADSGWHRYLIRTSNFWIYELTWNPSSEHSDARVLQNFLGFSILYVLLILSRAVLKLFLRWDRETSTQVSNLSVSQQKKSDFWLLKTKVTWYLFIRPEAHLFARDSAKKDIFLLMCWLYAHLLCNSLAALHFKRDWRTHASKLRLTLCYLLFMIVLYREHVLDCINHMKRKNWLWLWHLEAIFLPA